MAEYTMTHTGAQLDEAAALALNPDETPALNSQNLITSGAVAAADEALSERLDDVEAGKAPLASPAFTGTPTVPTPAEGDDSGKIATTEFVNLAVGNGGKPLLITKSTSASTAFDMISTAFNNNRLVYYDYRISGTNHRVLLPLMAKNTNSSAPSVTFWFEGFDLSDKIRYRIMISRSGSAGSYSYSWGSIDSIAFPDPPGSSAGYYTLKAHVYYNGSKYVTSVYWAADS